MNTHHIVTIIQMNVHKHMDVQIIQNNVLYFQVVMHIQEKVNLNVIKYHIYVIGLNKKDVIEVLIMIIMVN